MSKNSLELRIDLLVFDYEVPEGLAGEIRDCGGSVEFRGKKPFRSTIVNIPLSHRRYAAQVACDYLDYSPRRKSLGVSVVSNYGCFSSSFECSKTAAGIDFDDRLDECVTLLSIELEKHARQSIELSKTQAKSYVIAKRCLDIARDNWPEDFQGELSREEFELHASQVDEKLSNANASTELFTGWLADIDAIRASCAVSVA